MRHHLISAGRTPHPKRRLASARPTGQPWIWNADDMVGVQVSKEQGVDLCERNLDLLNALSGASAAVEKQLLLAGFDEDAGPEAIHSGLWGACAQKRYSQILTASSHNKNYGGNQQEKALLPCVLDRNVH